MVDRKDQWSGTLMLIVQPAEERVLGARAMRDDGIWERFGTPDYALAFHVGAGAPAGKIDAPEGPAYAGADTVDIIVHGVGAHGAAPHAGKDPVLIGSQIVVALQTLVSRELAPHAPGVVTAIPTTKLASSGSRASNESRSTSVGRRVCPKTSFPRSSCPTRACRRQ